MRRSASFWQDALHGELAGGFQKLRPSVWCCCHWCAADGMGGGCGRTSSRGRLAVVTAPGCFCAVLYLADGLGGRLEEGESRVEVDGATSQQRAHLTSYPIRPVRCSVQRAVCRCRMHLTSAIPTSSSRSSPSPHERHEPTAAATAAAGAGNLSSLLGIILCAVLEPGSGRPTAQHRSRTRHHRDRAHAQHLWRMR